MDTGHNSQTDKAREDREKKRKEQKIERLSGNDQTQQLLKYYSLSLTEDMTPAFGADQQLELAIYHDGKQIKQVVYPTLDYLSQDLGFANKAGYEEIESNRGLKKTEMAVWRNRLLGDALKRGKNELNRHLHDLRPLLMERDVYFYATPVALVKTEVETGRLTRAGGMRVLNPLPASVDAAGTFGCSRQRTKELASQVAWLIPMLVVYKQVKDVKRCLECLDGWKSLLTRPELEKVHTSLVKHAPSIVSEQITQLLLH